MIKEKDTIFFALEREEPPIILTTVSKDIADLLIPLNNYIMHSPKSRLLHSIPIEIYKKINTLYESIISNNEGISTPETKIRFILLSYGIHLFIPNSQYSSFENSLFRIFFAYPQQNSHFLEKAFNMKYGMDSPDYESLHLSLFDPIDIPFSRLLELFKTFKLTHRIDCSPLLNELYLILLQIDRYTTSLWAVSNLSLRINKKFSVRLKSTHHIRRETKKLQSFRILVENIQNEENNLVRKTSLRLNKKSSHYQSTIVLPTNHNGQEIYRSTIKRTSQLNNTQSYYISHDQHTNRINRNNIERKISTLSKINRNSNRNSSGDYDSGDNKNIDGSSFFGSNKVTKNKSSLLLDGNMYMYATNETTSVGFGSTDLPDTSRDELPITSHNINKHDIDGNPKCKKFRLSIESKNDIKNNFDNNVSNNCSLRFNNYKAVAMDDIIESTPPTPPKPTFLKTYKNGEQNLRTVNSETSITNIELSSPIAKSTTNDNYNNNMDNYIDRAISNSNNIQNHPHASPNIINDNKLYQNVYIDNFTEVQHDSHQKSSRLLFNSILNSIVRDENIEGQTLQLNHTAILDSTKRPTESFSITCSATNNSITHRNNIANNTDNALDRNVDKCDNSLNSSTITTSSNKTKRKIKVKVKKKSALGNINNVV